MPQKYTADQQAALAAFDAARDAEQAYVESAAPTLAGQIQLEQVVSAAKRKCTQLGLSHDQIYQCGMQGR